MLRIPFFMEALTASWSTRTGKLKLRENSPTLRSETQYLASGSFGCSWALATSVVVSFAASSSSTVALCPLWWSLDSPPSVMAPVAAGPSTKPAGGVPEVYERSERPLTVNVLFVVSIILPEVERDYLLGIGELDLNILLLNAWKFSMKFVGVGNLLDIELGAEGLQVRAVMTTLRNVATRVLIEVIEKSEEGGEGSVGIVWNKWTREERHVACWCSCVDDGSCWF
jgi:hypothetical protein